MPLIKAVHFKNFKGLRDSVLPLRPFTLLVGPNGSGKTTALQGIIGVSDVGSRNYWQLVSAGSGAHDKIEVSVTIEWGEPHSGGKTQARWHPGGHADVKNVSPPTKENHNQTLSDLRSGFRIYSLDPNAIASAVNLKPAMELMSNGAQLAGVLDRLRDQEPERFQSLNEELARWLPEFDQILFDTPSVGHRSIKLRMREGHHAIPATNLSQGTLIAIAILTLCYLPSPPPVICFEEPDRGIHPRLLREIKEALYRLSYPEAFGEKRAPVQVVATTHSPYLLDLFKDHPEEIVIAQKAESNIKFESLADRDDLEEILKDAHLGEVSTQETSRRTS